MHVLQSLASLYGRVLSYAFNSIASYILPAHIKTMILMQRRELYAACEETLSRRLILFMSSIVHLILVGSGSSTSRSLSSSPSPLPSPLHIASTRFRFSNTADGFHSSSSSRPHPRPGLHPASFSFTSIELLVFILLLLLFIVFIFFRGSLHLYILPLLPPYNKL